jgi:hypothetical protein
MEPALGLCRQRTWVLLEILEAAGSARKGLAAAQRGMVIFSEVSPVLGQEERTK